MHDGEHHHLYTSPIIIRVISCRTFKCAGILGYSGSGRERHNTLFSKHKEQNQFEDIRIDQR